MPKTFVEETIEKLLRKEVKSIILITAGFKEIGKEGEFAEKRIVEKVKAASARIVGPNCMGVINSFNEIKLNATFVAEKPEIGGTAFLSQSGAIGAAVLNSLRETDIKFGHFISVGNKADVAENDLLNFWQNEEKIKTITLYLESFTDGKVFIEKFINNEITKPVVVLKAGRTKSGMIAASSHTGALGNSDEVVEAVLNQFGIIRADDLNDLFNTSKTIENFPSPKGNKIAVVTNAGGPAILCVDSLDKENLRLAKYCDETKNKLKEIVHPEGSINNPVDLLPGGTAEQFKEVNQILLDDENVDAVFSVFVEPVMVDAFEVVEKINSIETNKPLMQVVMPLPEFWENYRLNSNYKKPLFRNPEDPAKALSKYLFYSKFNRAKKYLTSQNEELNLTKDENGFLNKESIRLIGKNYKLPFITEQIIKSESELSRRIIFPVVVKGFSKELVHKSDAGAVKLNIKSKEELHNTIVLMKQDFEKNKIGCEEFLIQPFIKTKYEILIGGFRDPSFGPIIMFGTGGKYVEVYKDTAIKSAYLSDEDIDDMISSTKIYKLLGGARGATPVNLTKSKQIIKSAAQMMLDNSQITEFDFNPLIIDENDDLSIVDVRIKIN